MVTMHPTVFPGPAGLPPFPREEWEERITWLRSRIAARGLDALAIFGDARDHTELAWVSGFVPMMGFAVALVPVSGSPRLYLGLLGDDALKRLTWIEDVRPAREFAPQGRVGLAGARRIRVVDRRLLGEVEEGHDDLLDHEPRPREIELIRAAADRAENAAALVEAELGRGAAVSDALLSGQLSAIDQGSRDVRLMWSPDGTAFRPLESRVERAAAWYLAAEVYGYWGEVRRP